MKVCEETVLQEGSYTASEDFSFCLPFGAQVYASAGVIHYEAAPNLPPDGVYTSITIKNGCIVAVGNADLSVFNYAPCASTTSSNIVSSAVSGVSLQGGEGIMVVGTGTLANPYIISLTESYFSEAVSTSGDVYIQAGNDGVVVSGSGTASRPFTISHKESGQFNVINGMMFDRYGHLTRYTEGVGHSYVSEVIAGYGIDVARNQATQVVTVGLQKPANPINDTLIFGKYAVTFDEYNRVHKVTENTNVEGTGLYPNAYTTDFSTRVGSYKEFQILLAESACIKVEVDATHTSISSTTSDATDRVIDIAMTIDGKAQTFGITNAYRAIFISTAVYAAGTHTLRFTRPSAVSTDNSRYFITVTAVWFV